MWETIATKSYSYSHDDTMTDTVVTAYLEADEHSGALEVHKVTRATSPYISGGKSISQTDTKAGTIYKPSLGEIIRATSNTGNYYKFPNKWTAFNDKQCSAAEAIEMWKEEKGFGGQDDIIRKKVIDKINTMSGPELDNVRRVLRIVACKTIKEDIKKVAKALSRG